MALKLRPTDLGSGIDKDRHDYGFNTAANMLTAVDRDVSSGHEGGLVGAKIYNQTGDLVGCSEAPKWNLRKNSLN